MCPYFLGISMKRATKTKAELMKEIDGLRAQLKEREKQLSAMPEAEAQSSEIMARLIVNQATDITIVCDENGKIILASEVTHRYIGGNLLLRPFDAILQLRFAFPNSLRKEGFSVSEVLRGDIFSREEVILRRENQTFYFLLNARPLTDECRRIHGCVVMLTDITERKRMEGELLRLASFPQLDPNPVVEVDLAGHVHYSNPASEELFPDLKEAGFNHPWLMDLEKIDETLKTESRRTYVRELRVGDHWYQQTVHSVMEGSQIRIYGFDITGRKQAELLNQSLNNISLLINSSLDFDEIMNTVVREGCGALGTETAAVSLRKGDEWTVSYVHGFPREIIGTKMIDEEEPHAVLAVTTKQVVIINDAFNDGRVNREHMQKYNVRSVMVIPLTTKGKVIGVLFFNHHSRSFTFTKAQIDFAQKIGNSLSLALESTRLFEHLTKSEEELRRSRDELEIRVQERAKELSEQSRVLDSFFKFSITPFVILDKNFNFILVNEAYAKACHREVSEFLRHNHFEFYPSDAKAKFEQVVQTKKPYVAIARPFSFPDHPEWGLTYWDWTLTPVLDDTGEVEYLVFSLEDVTKPKRAEDAIKAERQRFNDALEMLPAYLVLLTPDHHVPFANRFFRERFGESHGLRCFEYLFGRSEPCDICETYSVLKTKAPHHWEWTGPDGRIYDVTDFPFADTDGSTLILEMGIDITEQKKIRKRIEATNILLTLFVKMRTRNDYLDAVLRLVQDWCGCRCAGVRVLDEKNYIPYESYTGFSQEFLESENLLSVKYDQCACIRVVTCNPDPQDLPVLTPAGSFRCENIFEFVGALSDEEKVRFRGICTKSGFKSVAIIPVRYRDKVLGAIHLADEREGRVSKDIVEFIESVAPLIGEAMNRFDLKEKLKDSENRLRHLSSQLLTVQENERKRISREIHDSIGQTLSAIKFGLESKLSQMDKGSAPPGVSLESIISLTQTGIEEARRIQMDLRPSILDDLGIISTLTWFSRVFQQTYSEIHIEKEIDVKENEVPGALKIVIYRISQEAMNNIAKHSKAGIVSLSLKKKETTIELTIQDNGRGFDLEATLSAESYTRGLGLNSMRERAEISGGSFSVESEIGKGTTIRVEWPLF